LSQRFSSYFYVPQVCSAVVFKKPETERILNNYDDEKDDGENDGADGIEVKDLPPGAIAELRAGSPVALQDGSTKVELREGSRVELREEIPRVELREGSRVELLEEKSRVELGEGSPTVEDFNRSDYTPPPIDFQLTLKLAPEKYTTSADGKYKISFGQHLSQLFLKNNGSCLFDYDD
jgi:hypothetical protein